MAALVSFTWQAMGPPTGLVLAPQASPAGAAAHHVHQLPETAAPVRKHIGILQMPLYGAGHPAIVQSDRRQINLIERHAALTVQRIADLGLKAPLLVHGIARKTGYETGRRFNSALDGARPVLPRQQLAHVHPGTESGVR